MQAKRVKSSAYLQNPGDYCITQLNQAQTNGGLAQKPSLLVVCPKCKVAFAAVGTTIDHEIPLVVKGPIVCAYNQHHRFTIIADELTEL
jgi:hypothetical protein